MDARDIEILAAVNKRRVLTKIRIDEISAVDRPAQEGALAMIMKRETAGSIDAKDFEEIVVDIAKRDGCGDLRAMQKARIEHPDAFEKYQVEGRKTYEDEIAKADRERDRGTTGHGFLIKVAQLEAGGKVSKTEALRKARQLYPEEFKAYQGA